MQVSRGRRREDAGEISVHCHNCPFSQHALAYSALRTNHCDSWCVFHGPCIWMASDFVWSASERERGPCQPTRDRREERQNKMKLAIFLLASLCYAQPTISPSSKTLGPGESVTFHATAGRPYWLRSGTFVAGVTFNCPIGTMDCTFVAPGSIANSIVTGVTLYDANNFTLPPAQATVNLTPQPSCTCPAGPKGDTGPIGLTGAQGNKGDKGDTGQQGLQGPIGPQGLAGVGSGVGTGNGDYLVKFLTNPNAPGLCATDIRERNAYTYDDSGYLYVCMRTNEADSSGNFSTYRWKRSPVPFLVAWP